LDPVAELSRIAADIRDLGEKVDSLHTEVHALVEERTRQYKYRFSQSVVFGLPVLALQYWGDALGPADWQRWASLLQALLCGWVVYVNLGMLFDGLVWLFVPRHRKIHADLLVSLAAVALYAYSMLSALPGIFFENLPYPLRFDWCVMILAAWTGLRWWRLGRRLAIVHAHASDRPD